MRKIIVASLFLFSFFSSAAYSDTSYLFANGEDRPSLLVAQARNPAGTSSCSCVSKSCTDGTQVNSCTGSCDATDTNSGKVASCNCGSCQGTSSSNRTSFCECKWDCAANRVAGGFSPPAPTAPRTRVRTGLPPSDRI